ncbi:uncharacterized protein LOC124260185 [Haliotis rubra]|uniref:uncharacterized protein LOC124260185 n=1 Tax=Haliotis rubra TaxID=36100 RepID=UPI001EE577F8|nr:uncharacterized protein LOC124260185 [Haliotis rubra]
MKPSSKHGYQVVSLLHNDVHFNKNTSLGHRHRLLGIMKVLSVIYILLGLITTALGGTLVALALDRPRFTFSTGLPLMTGVMKLFGSIILCFISVRASKFRKYTSPQLCKWQCAMLYFCYAGVLVLGTLNVVLTFSETDIQLSLIQDHSRVPMFPMGIASAALIAVDLLGGIVCMVIFCLYKHQGEPGFHAKYNPSIQHNEHIEKEVNYRLMMLRKMLPKYSAGHLAPHGGVTSSAVHKQNTQTHVDQKGYYVWDVLPTLD